MEIANINVRTPEDRLLWAALIVLTTSPGLMIKGQPVAGTKTTPEEMVAILEDLATLNEKLAPDLDFTGDKIVSAADPGNVAPSTMSSGPGPVDERQPRPDQ